MPVYLMLLSIGHLFDLANQLINEWAPSRTNDYLFVGLLFHTSVLNRLGTSLCQGVEWHDIVGTELAFTSLYLIWALYCLGPIGLGIRCVFINWSRKVLIFNLSDIKSQKEALYILFLDSALKGPLYDNGLEQVAFNTYSLWWSYFGILSIKFCW
jgi:hypothetical protein